MDVERMVLLAEYDSIAQAEMAKSILDGAGIWTMINNEYMSAIYPTGVMPAQLIVAECDLVKARSILNGDIDDGVSNESGEAEEEKIGANAFY